MPWSEKDLMLLRKEFVLQANKKAIPFARLCRMYNISRKTGYKWLARYQQKEVEPFMNKSTKPSSTPTATSEQLVKQIIRVRQAHPKWGGRKIRAYLIQQQVASVPAASTISGILKRRGYVDLQAQRHPNYQRFEHDSPNHLWQMDFKGHFAYESGRCHPLTMLDDRSRFLLCLQACKNEQKLTVQEQLIRVFQRYGLPERINVDNGAPWGSLFKVCRYTSLSVWLIKHGVQVSYSRPHHPQTNGKIERLHRTLKSELLSATYFRSLEQIQTRFNEWQNCYNVERPHEALNMQVPAHFYQPSYREYQEKVAEYEYSKDYQLYTIDVRGRLAINGYPLFVGVPFAKELLGVRQTNIDGQIEIYFRHQKLGRVNLTKFNKGEHLNLYKIARDSR